MGVSKEEFIIIADSVTESNKHDVVAIALSDIFYLYPVDEWNTQTKSSLCVIEVN